MMPQSIPAYEDRRSESPRVHRGLTLKRRLCHRSGMRLSRLAIDLAVNRIVSITSLGKTKPTVSHNGEVKKT